VDAAGLTTGNGLLLEGGTGTTMSTGSLLKLETSSTSPLYGVMQVIANSMTSGNAVKVESNDLTTGTGFLLSSTSNNLKDALSPISSSSISSDGVFTVGINGEESNFAPRDYVTMSGCSTNSNNGDYRIFSTSTNVINLMNTDGTPISGLVDTDTDCTLSHSGGRLMKIVADHAIGGSIVDISTTGLQSGSALKVTTNALTTGKAIEIAGGSGLTSGALLSVTSSASGSSKATNGIIQMTATSLDEGKAMVMNVAGLTSGTGLEVTSNTALTSGHLLHLATASSQATKPVLIAADAVTRGTVVHVDAAGLTTGNGLLLEGGTGTTMSTGSL